MYRLSIFSVVVLTTSINMNKEMTQLTLHHLNVWWISVLARSIMWTLANKLTNQHWRMSSSLPSVERIRRESVLRCTGIMIVCHFTSGSEGLGRKHFHREKQLFSSVKSLYHRNMATSSSPLTKAERRRRVQRICASTGRLCKGLPLSGHGTPAITNTTHENISLFSDSLWFVVIQH